MKRNRIRSFIMVGLAIASFSVIAQPADGQVKRYLYGSLHLSKTFYEPTRQGVFVYDINKGHKLVREFPARKWEVFNQHQNSGYVYCISPQKPEVVRKLGPVTMDGMADVQTTSDTESNAREAGTAGHLTLEPEHQLASIQHFSVDETEKYVYAEPVKAKGLGIIDIESGQYLGRWDISGPKPGSLRERRYSIKEAEANQLHSKRNHGIAARLNSYEVWMTEDRWGFLHVWDVSSLPPRYVRGVPVFDDIRQPIRDFSWVNFSIDGKYVYASNRVIDATRGVIIAKLDGLNEACLEIQMKEGKVVRTGHDMGSGLATWIRGYGPASLKKQIIEASSRENGKKEKISDLSGEELIAKGFKSLFNGRDLTGWDGPPGAWWIEDGALTWENTAEDPLKDWPFLIREGGQPGDFELLVDFRLSPEANSGVNFRSTRLDDQWALGGYQADVTGDGKLTGTIYRDHPSRPRILRGQRTAVSQDGTHHTVVFAGESEILSKSFRPGKWNSMRVVCKGPIISYYLNGMLVSELIDNGPHAKYKGYIGLQMHQGPPMKVQYKNIYLREF